MQESAACSRFAVDASRSSLTFEAKSSLHGVHGKATGLAGFVSAAWHDGVMATAPPPAIHVEFNVEKLSSGSAMQDREMWKLIDSRRFPLVAADLRELRDGPTPGSYAASGDITLAGRSHRYDGVFTAARSGAEVTIDGTLRVDIRDFGIRPPRFLMLKVEPEVDVKLHLITLEAP